MALRTLVIANPASAGGRTRARFSKIERVLREALGPYELVWTAAPGDGTRLAREAARAGVERIVAAGGDGTASELASGVLEAGLGTSVVLGFLPFGTGGDIHRSLEIPRDPVAAAALLEAGRIREIDVGCVSLGGDPPRRRRWFINVASFGASASVAGSVGRTSKQLGGLLGLGPHLAFGLGALRGVARFRPAEVAARDGSEDLFRGPLAFGALANGRCFGGGMRVAPQASLDDGWLDFCFVPALPKRQLLYRLPGLYSGRYLRHGDTRHGRCRELEVSSLDGPVDLELDGECVGTLPARFEVSASALRTVAGP